MTRPTTKTLAAATAALILLSGCLSPQDQDKAHDVKADELINKHLVVTCDFTTDGHQGVHVTIRDCDNGRITSGHIEEVDITYSGLDSTQTWWRTNRQAEITGTVYFPPPAGNSQPFTETYAVDAGKTGSFGASVKIPLDLGKGNSGLPGTYKVCWNLGGYKDTSSWKPGLQGAADPTQPDPTCVTFKIGSTGILGVA